MFKTIYNFIFKPKKEIGNPKTELIMEDQDKPTLTYGQKAVGVTFNPSGSEQVNSVKSKFAELIDELHAIQNNPEAFKFAKQNAQKAEDYLIDGCMRFVKALTYTE